MTATVHDNFEPPNVFTVSNIVAVLGLVIAIVGLIVAIHQFGPDRTYGACNLKVPTSENKNLAVFHLQSGLRYAKQKQYDLAERDFLNVLKTDQHFVGANLNLGYAYLAQGKLDDAEESFMKELDSIKCLKSVGDSFISHLSEFTYMLDDSQKTGQNLKNRLDHAEDITHYDLACLRVKQKNTPDALRELNKAAGNCTISEKTARDDLELGPLKGEPDAFEAFAKCPPHL